MEWIEHGERSIYESPWVSLHLVDVEVPGGSRFDHHVLRHPAAAAGAVVHDVDRGILLIWRHRFITRTWGWEIPAGRIEAGEEVPDAAHREVLEETGWEPFGIRHLFGYYPSNGISDLRFEILTAAGATYVGDPSDPSESERVAWLPVEDVKLLIGSGQISDGLTLTALLWWLVNC
jgi:8-oxo-dGTP pyrophosphatase MutT (NUDIX family)